MTMSLVLVHLAAVCRWQGRSTMSVRVATLKVVGLVLLGLLTAARPLGAKGPTFGALEVLSEPSDAGLYIEGFLAGHTPVKVDRVLPGGPYRLVLKKGSYDDYVKDLRVTAGEITKVQASLTPDSGSWHSAVRHEDDWSPILKQQMKQYKKAKSQRSFRTYRLLEVSNFLMKSDVVVQPRHLYSLLRDLALQLDRKTKFQSFVTNYKGGPSARWLATGGGSSEPTLVLSGVVTGYRPGSRARRAAIGFGYGKTEIHCVFRISEKATGRMLFTRAEKGSVSGSVGYTLGGSSWPDVAAEAGLDAVFSGNSSKATKALASRMAKAIAANW